MGMHEMEKTVLLKFSAEAHPNLPCELNGKVDNADLIPREEQIKELENLLKEALDANEVIISGYELIIKGAKNEHT